MRNFTGTKPNKINGGIQRFKLGLHGAKYNLAAMIGYIQKHTAHHWYIKINNWILELVKKPIGDGCVWSEDEILEAFEEKIANSVYCCRSSHSRIGNRVKNKIEIHHLWIVMNVEN